ncbi:MAG: hypothetical protein DRP08_02245 [Candidatus Aenigmatarchaeota archaeon]|nr:MAG: hypothetical protein DRP08_02245 [Candidatus Aenigmarchaeota archaeon]
MFIIDAQTDLDDFVLFLAKYINDGKIVLEKTSPTQWLLSVNEEYKTTIVILNYSLQWKITKLMNVLNKKNE